MACEVAFKIEKGCEMYDNYFAAQHEKQKFHDFAREFFKKHDLLQSGRYYIRERLALELNDEQQKKYMFQLRKDKDENGFCQFKTKSAMQKEWKQTVVDKVDMNVIHQMNHWYFYYINRGTYALWDKDGVIYGMLSDTAATTIDLSPYMTQIKLSEYYAMVEQWEEEHKKN